MPLSPRTPAPPLPGPRARALPAPSARRAPPAAGSGDCRCACGSLLARLVPGGVELKCRRCKRTLRLPLERPVSPR